MDCHWIDTEQANPDPIQVTIPHLVKGTSTIDPDYSQHGMNTPTKVDCNRKHQWQHNKELQNLISCQFITNQKQRTLYCPSLQYINWPQIGLQPANADKLIKKYVSIDDRLSHSTENKFRISTQSMSNLPIQCQLSSIWLSLDRQSIYAPSDNRNIASHANPSTFLANCEPSRKGQDWHKNINPHPIECQSSANPSYNPPLT